MQRAAPMIDARAEKRLAASREQRFFFVLTRAEAEAIFAALKGDAAELNGLAKIRAALEARS